MAALKNQLDALACRQASESMLPGYPRLEMYSFCPTSILGDPGADKGGEGKSKRAEIYIWNEEK